MPRRRFLTLICRARIQATQTTTCILKRIWNDAELYAALLRASSTGNINFQKHTLAAIYLSGLFREIFPSPLLAPFPSNPEALRSSSSSSMCAFNQ